MRYLIVASLLIMGCNHNVDVVQRPQSKQMVVYVNHCDKGYSMEYLSFEGDIFDSSTLPVCIKDNFKQSLMDYMKYQDQKTIHNKEKF